LVLDPEQRDPDDGLAAITGLGFMVTVTIWPDKIRSQSVELASLTETSSKV
jgi:hypothetical protein